MKVNGNNYTEEIRFEDENVALGTKIRIALERYGGDNSKKILDALSNDLGVQAFSLSDTNSIPNPLRSY